MLRLRLAALSLLVLTLAACGATSPSSGATTGPATQAASAGAPSASDGATDEPAATDEPSATDEPAATESPAESSEPADSLDPSASESPSGSPGPAAACSGSAENRQFYENFARVVDWTVLCGVLPKGWFVSQGSYRQANGGKLLISYRGPGGATTALSEGAWCAAADGCVPAGTELGAAPLGPLGGTVYETADGFSVLAAVGENPSWQMTTKGLDRATTEALAARLAVVGG